MEVQTSYIRLNLPSYSFRIRSDGQNKQIFDAIRKKFVALTPEEWVRQNFIRFLIEEKKYPASCISVEKGMKLNTRQKRMDAVIYGNDAKPWMLVECKNPEVEISEDTLFQAGLYNMKLKVQYIVFTNGIEHYCCKRENEKFVFTEDLPEYISG